MSTVPKPALSYTVGRKLTLRPHHPSPPIDPPEPSWDGGVKAAAERQERDRQMADQTPEQKCVSLAPLPGTTSEDTMAVEVIKELRIGDDRNSQLAVVRIVHNPRALPDEEMVAKFYDPLYYIYDDVPIMEDPFYSVNLAYTHESAAYRHFTDLQGTIIPRFYGSFTLDLPTEYGRSRNVRLILTQYITNALPINELDPAHYSKRDRQTIIKSIVDAESKIYARDLHHRDFEQRNILITQGPRLMVVDLGHAEFGRMGSNDPEFERQWFAGHVHQSASTLDRGEGPALDV